MTNHQEVIKLREECKKFFINRQKDNKLSLDLEEFYAWVKYGYACGVNHKNREKEQNTELLRSAEK